MATSEAGSAQPYATLLAFTRYVNRTGPAKAGFVGGLRKQREAGGGFNPHGQLVKALKADIQFRTKGTHLKEIVKTVNPRWQRLYASLAEGALRYLGTLTQPVSLLPARDALGIVGSLPVKVGAHFGLLHEDGSRECVRLHFDEEPPTAEATTATLHLMSNYMDQMLPDAEPVLVDLRRGEAHRMDELRGNPSDVERWLAGEAAGFTAMWRAA
ncbi:MAG TPA: hypothetical protein DGG94_10840 [Micromonosporaceae bacterium]|nr:hypothetical protein [Micromonosporaceae bacterium]HCU50275.1 hypothetical protein [Micromonosporaceae bacterium]